MRKRLLILACVVVCVLVGITVAGFALYSAAQQVPEFYEQALQADPKLQEVASDEMLQQAAALANDAKKPGQWQAVFTAEQINGWLAVDLERNYPDVLPESLSDPRVAIEPEQIWIACRLDQDSVKSVISLAIDVYLAEPNVIALRFRKARAGLLPLPLGTILDQVSERAEEMDVDVRWRQADGDPVVEVRIPPPHNEDDKLIRIETLRLGEGEVYLAGSTEEQ